MASRLLPLFPLSLVLLPSTPLPLHIFEERYKQMMSDILAKDDPFGVVLAKDEGIVSIGCSATVQKILQRYPDGRLDLVALGQRRFRIESLDQDKLYLRGEVEFLDDSEASEPSDDLKHKVIGACDKLRAFETPGIIVEPSLNDPRLSFQVGQFISDTDKRQALLSLESEEERLRYLLSILPSYLAEREQAALAKKLAPRNGHAKHVHQ